MGKSKSIEERFHPLDEWVFFKRIKTKSPIHLPDGTQTDPDYECVVISHGPGSYRDGVFVPVPDVLVVGVIFMVPANHCKQSKRWAEQDLFVCPASSIIGTMDREDDMDLMTVFARKNAAVKV